MIPLVVTVLGTDDSGVLQRLSSVVAGHGANWEESRLVNLAGRFVGMVKVSVPEASEAALVRGLEQLDGLRVVIVRGEEPQPGRPLLRVEVTATDRAGIVRDVSAVIADLGGQLEAFETRYVEVPMTGGFLFRASLRVADVADPSALATALQQLADDLVVDLPRAPL